MTGSGFDRPEYVVSLRFTAWVFTAFKERGLSIEPLIEGLPYDLNTLSNPKATIDWESFCLFCDNCEKNISEEMILEIARTSLRRREARITYLFVRQFMSLTDSYKWAFSSGTGMIPKTYPAVRTSATVLGKGHVQIKIVAREGLRFPRAFAVALKGQIEEFPALYGKPLGNADIRTIERGVLFDVTYIDGTALFAPIRRSFSRLFSGSKISEQLFDALQAEYLALEMAMEKQRSVDAALKESEAQFDDALKDSRDALFKYNLVNSSFDYISPSMQSYTGMNIEAYSNVESGMDFSRIHPDDHEPVRKILATMRDRTPSDPFMPNLEYRFKHSRGYRWISENRRIIFDDEGVPISVVGNSRDITPQKEAEEEKRILEDQYRQSQKVEAIGRLAGGVAHDLNNLLTPIMGYTNLLDSEMVSTKKGDEYVEQILLASGKARDLVGRLLAFSRKQTLDYTSVNLNDAIRSFEKLLSSALRDDIKFHVKYSEDSLPILADVGQIEQVILNLVVNAQDSMPDGGMLNLETGLAKYDDAFFDTHSDLDPGEHVMLSISDTGCGMDTNTQERIFEPFFSTKGEEGTGLGLATVYGIVKQHKGGIGVVSEIGIGTTFTIYLPVSELVETLQERTTIQASEMSGSETILLVEDNESVRKLTKTILEAQGYKVLSTESGPESLEVIDSYTEDIHLLFSDVVMPGMNGKDLHKKVLEKLPNIKVLFMSGYADDVIDHEGMLDAAFEFIQKPFGIAGLAAKVREVLEGRKATD